MRGPNIYRPSFTHLRNATAVREKMVAGVAAGIEACKTPGQKAYEADCKARPIYDDGTKRREWAALDKEIQWSWERAKPMMEKQMEVTAYQRVEFDGKI